MASAADGTNYVHGGGTMASPVNKNSNTNGDNDGGGEVIVRKSDIRPLDVLMGRGHFHHPGNVRFLRIVAARKEEYVAEKSYATKAQIATEVIDQVYDPNYLSGAECGFAESDHGGDGDGGVSSAATILQKTSTCKLPGRFLQLESGDIGEPTSVWRAISGKAVIDKVKMTLRQKSRGKAAAVAAVAAVSPEIVDGNNNNTKGETVAAPPYNAYMHEYSSSQNIRSKQEGKRPRAEAAATLEDSDVRDNSTRAEPSGNVETQLLPSSEYLYGVGDCDDDLFFDDLNLDGEDENVELEIGQGKYDTNRYSDGDGTKNGIENQHTPSNGRGDSSGQPCPPAAARPAPAPCEAMIQARQRLLGNLQFALKRAQMLLSEHQAAAVAGELNWTAVPGSLEALGRELFLYFTGVDPFLFQQAQVGTNINASASPAVSAADAATTPSTDDNPTNQRQRKRTGMVGSVKDGSPSPSLSTTSASPGLGGGPASLSDRLRDAGLPVSLCTVIISLLDATDPTASDRYLSSTDAEADLGRMFADPDRYLFDPPMDRHSGTLYFIPNRLYGRTEEWSQVKLAFDKIVVTQKEIHGYLLISGPPGSGKTALVEKLRDSLAERRGMVVWIKFDSQQQENPMINICRGLDEYFQSLLCGDSTLLLEIGSAVKEALGSNMIVLKDLIPTLGIAMGGWPESHHDIEGRETYNLILYCIKKLVNAIAHPSHPVIVLFDDLQWSDAASQEIIRMLVTDEASRAAMFIGCYRDNEVDANHPVAENVGAILMALVPLATITLGNLDKESVNDLCSDVLQLSPRLTRPLAEALHSKTSGNPMFVRQLMRSLYEEGLLQYSASERRWRWDINAIRSKDVADNAVDLLIAMMRSYRPELRWLLQIASCLGFRFDRTAIALLASASEEMVFANESLISINIEAAMADGLLVKDGADAYRFSHDQIWLAAYSLTPPVDRDALHLRIGRQLHEKASDGDDDDADSDTFLYTAADQLKRGLGAVKDHAEELEIAKLNLRAGEKALSTFLFQPAATYLLQGCALLRPETWYTEYKLCARLYLACAEVQLAQGDNGGAMLSVAPVLTNARHEDGKLRAHEIQILANIAQAKFQEALQHSAPILGELGINVSNTDPAAIQSELVKTLALLDSSDITGQTVIQSILSKPTSIDSWQIGHMRILCYSARAAYGAKPTLMLFIILRMVQKVVSDNEITAESSYAFANLSFALSGLGIHNVSFLASKLALALLDRFDQKYSNTVVCILNSSTMLFRQPIQACFPALRQCYKDAVSVGDRDYARISINQMSQMHMMAPERGKTLDDVEKEIRQVLTEFSTQMEGSKSLLILSVLHLQMLLNLKEESPIGTAGADDPTILTGNVMNQEEYLQICEEKGVRDYFRFFFCCRLCLAYLFRRHNLAEDMVKACEEIAQLAKFCSSMEIITETFYMGLIAAEANQRRRGVESAPDIERWQQLANSSLKLLTKWAEEGSEWNFLHKADLLRAEIAVANNDYDTAVASYRSAIVGAGKSGYINEEALSCERAGLFYYAQGEVEEGKLYLSRAVSLYKVWGARRKALDVLLLMGS